MSEHDEHDQGQGGGAHALPIDDNVFQQYCTQLYPLGDDPFL